MIIKHDIIDFNTKNCGFEVDEILITRYLKGVYRNNEKRFKDRFVNIYKRTLKANGLEEFLSIIDNIEYMWKFTTPFSYKEVFEIDNQIFRSKVFASIDIREMIENLGAERVNTEGKDLINKTWNTIENKFEDVPYTVVYELYHVNGEKIGVNNSVLPVIKCWCTTTDEEHWLWVENDRFSNNSPLEAIASTCVVYESMKNKIKHIIRQGDVFLFEMTEDVTPSENENLINLSMNEYFSLLKTQS